MTAELVEEALVGRAVEEILAGVELEADVDAELVVASRIGRQRLASSSKAASIRPAGRGGHG